MTSYIADAVANTLGVVAQPLCNVLARQSNTSDFVGRVYGYLWARLPAMGIDLLTMHTSTGTADGSAAADVVTNDSGHATVADVVDTYSSTFYWEMLYDTARMQAYSVVSDVAKANPGKTWLDIGTGRHLPLIRMAVETGATGKAHAIEGNPATYEFAQGTLRRAGLQDKVQLHLGLSSDVVFAEEDKVDIIVHELIGTIASDEGFVGILADAQKRLLKPGGQILPCRIRTVCGAVESPTVRFPLVARFVQYFLSTGADNLPDKPCIRSYHPDWTSISWLSKYATLEEYDFSKTISSDTVNNKIRIPFTKSGKLAGLYLAPEFQVAADGPVCNGLDEVTSWGVYFVRLVAKGEEVPVKAGDVLEVNFIANHDFSPPKYTLAATLNGRAFEKHAWQGMVGDIAYPVQL